MTTPTPPDLFWFVLLPKLIHIAYNVAILQYLIVLYRAAKNTEHKYEIDLPF